MKKTILMCVAFIASAATQASTLVCSSAPDQNGGTYNVTISQAAPNAPVKAVLTESGGEAHYIRLIDQFEVQVKSPDSTQAEYFNDAKIFDMNVGLDATRGMMVGSMAFSSDKVCFAKMISCKEQTP